ncbi:hypothetical protein [Actinoplanes sp. NBRC 103695]|uniref:hypothetical protein n=1 Tax=Actinoplanes sp. NBRC 103695 TaxID=3032202 RepID=UPI0025535D8C|nr:hypothetical protein [Actinoplanes sp. NBRC 103695]
MVVLLSGLALNVIDVGWNEAHQATAISLDEDSATEALRGIFRMDHFSGEEG